jgi:type IV pilus biogenesis protein CpaD/CtpE
MWLRIVSLVVLMAGLAGCSGKDSVSAAKSPATQRLPLEVSGNPEDALSKSKAPPRRP